MDTFDVLGWLLVLNLRCQPSTEAIGWQISKMAGSIIISSAMRWDMLDPFAVEFPAQIVPADPTSGRLHGCLSPACFAASGFFISFIDAFTSDPLFMSVRQADVNKTREKGSTAVSLCEALRSALPKSIGCWLA